MAGASITAMSRRDFLVRGAAGLGCLAWDPGARGFSSPVTSPLRIGVIGGEPAAAVWRGALARLDGAGACRALANGRGVDGWARMLE